MVKNLKTIVEKHPAGYVAYPLGVQGAVVGKDDTYEGVLADVKSALEFHVETFGSEMLKVGPLVLEALCQARFHKTQMRPVYWKKSLEELEHERCTETGSRESHNTGQSFARRAFCHPGFPARV